jgi:hypothetical protein
MLIINGGMPRSGTVLVGNLVRLLLEHRGIAWRRYNPQERRHLPDFLKLVQHAPIDGAIIVHTHLIDAAIVTELARKADAILFWNHRDPRDALVSLMQLHDLSLQDGLKAMRIYCEHVEIAQSSDTTTKVSYEDLIAELPNHIDMLATRLNFRLEIGEAEELIRLTSPAAHSDIMDQLQQDALEGGRTITTKRRVLREDPTTLVNDRHIQSGRSGRWRAELSPEAQHQANDQLAKWIGMFGYELGDAGIN